MHLTQRCSCVGTRLLHVRAVADALQDGHVIVRFVRRVGSTHLERLVMSQDEYTVNAVEAVPFYVT